MAGRSVPAFFCASNSMIFVLAGLQLLIAGVLIYAIYLYRKSFSLLIQLHKKISEMLLNMQNQNNVIEQRVVLLHKRVDAIFTVDPSAANDQSLFEKDNEEFDEQNFYNLPADIKLEVEGGDTQTPPNHSEK